jgi:hypothetical protein
MVLNDGVADTLASAMAPHRKGYRRCPGARYSRQRTYFWPKSTKKGATTPVTTAKGYRDLLLGLGPFYANRPLSFSSPSPSLRLIG